MTARLPQAFLLLSTLSLGACTGWCGDKTPQTGATPPVQSARQATAAPGDAVPASLEVEIPTGAWTDLARRLVDAKDLTTATAVTREVLALGGVGTADGSRTLVSAVAPAASFAATPAETIRLAMEARRRRTAARLTAAELAQMLEGFGWPFPNTRESGGAAAERPRGQVKEPERLREAEQKEREAQREAERAASDKAQAALDAEEQMWRDRGADINRRLMEATKAWQISRGAWARAPLGDKAAADARMKEAAAAREALIEERRQTDESARKAQEDRRARAREANQERYGSGRV